MQLQVIESKIFEVRGLKVMLDFNLAEMYEVPTKALKQAVNRNIERFPKDFMFEITKGEFESLRSQFATSNKRGGTRYMPYAFTEQGVAMLSLSLIAKRQLR
ncbi:MAG TPA: ORF6N domain-containing protein [Saprospiraceae bacterium]|nr:ORF6N domain-containing protein [Saprospiraceae bacterium]HUN16588.1 ORF6N domain-containing protein [Saprospiraceae bacterium]